MKLASTVLQNFLATQYLLHRVLCSICCKTKAVNMMLGNKVKGWFIGSFKLGHSGRQNAGDSERGGAGLFVQLIWPERVFFPNSKLQCGQIRSSGIIHLTQQYAHPTTGSHIQQSKTLHRVYGGFAYTSIWRFIRNLPIHHTAWFIRKTS